MNSIKNIWCLILLLTVYLCSSQGNIKVKYKIDSQLESTNSILNSTYSDSKKYIDQIEFLLESNSEYTRFSLIDNIINTKYESKLALALANYFNSDIYQDLSTNLIYFNNEIQSSYFKKNEFLVKDEIFSSWKLENETKVIDGFVCYKASGVIKPDNLRVVAWYCPDIPLKSGPLGFGNLPGLILHLQLWSVNYYCSSISYDKLDSPLILPNIGKQINSQEYFDILINRMKTGFNKQ